MFYFDAHCDTLSTGRNLFSNKGHFDLERAMERGPGVQVMAAFGAGKEGQLARMRLAQERLPRSFRLIGSFEGGDEIDSVTDLALYLNMGMQILGLTWNNDNRLAGGCGGSGRGLTALGREVVAACDEMDIILDLAHSSEKTFSEVLELAKNPVMVSHTCCGALHTHRRNLSDSQIRQLALSGGVAGICFVPGFLSDTQPVSIETVVAHITHAVNIGGTEAVGIGSDFDGCESLPEGLSGVQDIPRLSELLPYSDDIKEKIMGGNFLRLMV